MSIGRTSFAPRASSTTAWDEPARHRRAIVLLRDALSDGRSHVSALGDATAAAMVPEPSATKKARRLAFFVQGDARLAAANGADDLLDGRRVPASVEGFLLRRIEPHRQSQLSALGRRQPVRLPVRARVQV